MTDSQLSKLQRSIDTLKKNVSSNTRTIDVLDSNVTDLRLDVKEIKNIVEKRLVPVADVMLGNEDLGQDGIIKQHYQVWDRHQWMEHNDLYTKIKKVVEFWGHIRWFIGLLGISSVLSFVLIALEVAKWFGII